MSRDLPLDTDKRLELVANGWGRTATHAHPDCRCGKPYIPSCWLCSAPVNKPCRHQWGDPLVLSDTGRARLHCRASRRAGLSKDCPLHRPERAR